MTSESPWREPTDRVETRVSYHDSEDRGPGLIERLGGDGDRRAWAFYGVLGAFTVAAGYYGYASGMYGTEMPEPYGYGLICGLALGLGLAGLAWLTFGGESDGD